MEAVQKSVLCMIYNVCYLTDVYQERSVLLSSGARCSSVVRAFAHGAMGRQIDRSRVGPIDLFLVLDSAPRLV